MDHFINYLNISSEYRIKLMSDAELEKNASVILTEKSIGTNTKIDIESSIFGMTKNDPCQICGQTKLCTCHYGLIPLNYPIITNTVIKDSFVKLIQLICPHCANFPITNAKESLNLRPEDRFKFIKNEVIKQHKTNVSICPYCQKEFIFITVYENLPSVKFVFKQEAANAEVQINPIYIYSLINNISDQTAEYAGFNPQTNHPKNYMTKFITIIPNRLRIKTLDSQSSSVTSGYKAMIELILPELNTLYHTTIGENKIIPENDNGKAFNKYYTQLMARYLLFIDMTKENLVNNCLAALAKNDKKHAEPSASMMGRLKDKESSYFEKGIVSFRHKVSTRIVIGGDTNIHSYEIGLPQKHCCKMGIFIPVYKQNLELMRQFVASMSEVQQHNYNLIKVNKVKFTAINELTTVKAENALVVAAKISPGDKLYISLYPGCIVYHSRFPAVREESFASHILIPSDNTCMTLPVSVCKYKNADFDGDETQIYAPFSQTSEIESLLLNSIFRQMIEFKKCKIGTLFQGGDSEVEISMLKADSLIGVKEIKTSTYGIKRVNYYPARTVKDLLKEFLDSLKINIKYIDSKLIIKDNLLDNEKCNLNNQNFYIYLSLTIGPYTTLKIIDYIIQMGYNFACYSPITFGNEIKFYSKESEKLSKEIHDKTYEEMKEIEKSSRSMIEKDREIYLLSEKQKDPINKILSESLKGTNLEHVKLSEKIGLYYQMLINMNHILIDGGRVHPKLLNQSRTCISYNQFSTDPKAYGYNIHGYISKNITPTETFFDCMMQRKGAYVKGNGTAKQGYLQKRFLMAYGQSVADCNGGVIFEDKFICPCYGNLSLNPRISIKQVLEDITLSKEEFNEKYKNYPELLKCYRLIKLAEDRYIKLTNYIKNEIINDIFIAPFDYDQYIKINEFKKGETDKKLIDELIDNLKKIFAPPGMKQRYSLINLVSLEYYFRQKGTKYIIPRKNLIEMYYYTINSFVDAGETVGMKAALAIGESLTQESLDAIHSASKGSVNIEKLERTKSGNRFEELLGGSVHKNAVLTLILNNPTKEETEKFAMEQETIYFKDIWTKLETVLSKKINPDVIKLHPKIHFEKLMLSKTYVKMLINLNILADFNIKISDLANVVYKNFEKVAFFTGKVVNANEFLAYIYFTSEITNEEIDNYVYIFKSETRDAIIHGEFIKNCFITQNVNTKEYLILCNEVNPTVRAYEKILYNPAIDPAKCHTTNTKLTLEMYGIFETGARLCEELLYCATDLSNVGELPARHYKTMALSSLANGYPFVADSSSALKSNIDYLRGCNFEQPTAFIKKAISNGTYKKVEDPVASAFYGELPKMGSGYTKILLCKKGK